MHKFKQLSKLNNLTKSTNILFNKSVNTYIPTFKLCLGGAFIYNFYGCCKDALDYLNEYIYINEYRNNNIIKRNNYINNYIIMDNSCCYNEFDAISLGVSKNIVKRIKNTILSPIVFVQQCYVYSISGIIYIIYKLINTIF